MLVMPILHFQTVAPHAGAWIEIKYMELEMQSNDVAPHAGAWIEIASTQERKSSTKSRSPCGSVD